MYKNLVEELLDIFVVVHLLQTLCVQAMLRKADTDKSSDISFAEFVEYMREHERKLRLAFSDLDRNKDGKTASLSLFYNC